VSYVAFQSWGSSTYPQQVQTPQNAHNTFNFGYSNDMSMELFDIDEHEYEHDTNHDAVHEDQSFSINLQAHQANTFGHPSYNYNPDAFQNTGIQFGFGNTLNIGDSLDHHFHTFDQSQPQQNSHRYDVLPHHVHNQRDTSRNFQQTTAVPFVRPAQIPIPLGDLSLPVIQKPMPQHPSRNAASMILPLTSDLISLDPSSASDCSVCLVKSAPSLAILKPCGHPLCSACLTSALNIVGEKDMECAVCRQSVQDFKLIVNSQTKGGLAATGSFPVIFRSLWCSRYFPEQNDTMSGKSFFDPIFSSPGSSNAVEGPSILPENDNFSDLECGFDFAIDFSPNEIRASTPKLEDGISPDSSPMIPGITSEQTPKDGVVLRIDNVPWASFR